MLLIDTNPSWWHEWKNDQFDELAGALVAGHLIECGSYVTGGFYSEFKDLIKVCVANAIAIWMKLTSL